MADLEWYYVNSSGEQCGPATESELKRAYDSQLTNDECLCWNETMGGWTAMKECGELMRVLKPPAPKPVIPAQAPVAPKFKLPTMNKPAAVTPAADPAPAAPTFSAPKQFGAPKPATSTTTNSFSAPKAATSPSATVSASSSASPASKFGTSTAASTTAKPAATAAKPAATRRTAEPAITDPDLAWQELQTPEGVLYYFNKLTNATTWDKPDALKTEAEMDKAGDWVWAPHEQEAFLPAKKIETYYDGRVEVEYEDGTRKIFAKTVQLDELTWSSLYRPTRDLVMLDVMNQPLILYNLKQRFLKNEIYTNVGTILISVNPYKLLPLYTPTIIDQYRNRGTKEMPPHVFTIADDAYNSLIEKAQSQSIVISGESGAGKTECTKQCLQYLAEVAGSSTNVESRILQANPILEAFGNAKTIRNNNSSRFGKYVEIFFDARNSICGARNTNYLLEKSRVCTTNGDERNYHIFYQLCAGATAAQRQKFYVQDAMSYSYLNQSGNVTVDGVNDAEEFAEVEAAFDGLSVLPEERTSIYQLVAFIMWLGNLDMKEVGDKKCEFVDKKPLGIIAELMQVDVAALTKALTVRVMVTRGQAPIDIGLSRAESLAARDALAKFVFGNLFDWLVIRINQSIGIGGGQKGKSIGILDIFGFEIFQHNSFEQLCINFTNEKLQQNFNNTTFKLEEAVYTSEKIQFTHVAFIDNQPVLDLIEQKPTGILPMIDEELRMPKGSDKSLIEKMHLSNKDKKAYGKVLSNPDNFLVRHYAGDVIYESGGFLVKNKDRLNEDLYDLLQTSKLQFLKDLFPKESEGGTSDQTRKMSLAIKFRNQLDDLMGTLNNTATLRFNSMSLCCAERYNTFVTPICTEAGS